MTRMLTPRDRALIRAVTATRPPIPSEPRWTHPLARMMALALGFDPNTGDDIEPWVHPTGVEAEENGASGEHAGPPHDAGAKDAHFMDSEIVAQPDETTEAARRRAYVNGLRQLAAFLEEHPDLPLPHDLSSQAYVGTKERLVACAREAGVSWRKEVTDGYYMLRVPFGGDVTYEVFVERGEVCRREVIGTKIVPAQPEQTVDEVRWICDEPLLASGGEA